MENVLRPTHRTSNLCVRTSSSSTTISVKANWNACRIHIGDSYLSGAIHRAPTCPKVKFTFLRAPNIPHLPSVSALAILIFILLFLPHLALTQEVNTIIPSAPVSDLYTFPELPTEDQIFSSQSFCRTTYTACMQVFSDCLRAVGGISGANQLCEQYRSEICEGGIREGCDGIRQSSQSGDRGEQSSTVFATGTETIAPTSTLSSNFSASISITETIGTIGNQTISGLPRTTSPGQPRPTTSFPRNPSSAPPSTVTITTTFLVPTTLVSIFTTTIPTTLTTTQTVTNSNGVVATTTWTMTMIVPTTMQRGLTFRVNDAGESSRRIGWKWGVWIIGVMVVLACI